MIERVTKLLGDLFLIKAISKNYTIINIDRVYLFDFSSPFEFLSKTTLLILRSKAKRKSKLTIV